MGTISRHANAPFQDGEILTGADLEGDFSTIYDEFNGSIDDANLADSAVTTVKLAASAVTQAKMTSGAATASEVQRESGATGYPIGTTFTNLGASISHTVGNPARHVAIYCSWTLVMQAATTAAIFKMLKGGTDMYTVSFSDQVDNQRAAQTFQTICRVYIDTAPTPGATHVYQLQAKGVGAAIGNYNLNIICLEPRS